MTFKKCNDIFKKHALMACQCIAFTLFGSCCPGVVSLCGSLSDRLKVRPRTVPFVTSRAFTLAPPLTLTLALTLALALALALTVTHTHPRSIWTRSLYPRVSRKSSRP